MDNVKYEDGALVLDWVVNDNSFAIALMDNGTEEMGSVLGTVTLFFRVCYSYSGLELPQPSRKLKCVHEYLRTRLAADLSGYEIDHIGDIAKPNDDNVANKPFHHNTFQHAKHRLVVKLRTTSGGTNISTGAT